MAFKRGSVGESLDRLVGADYNILYLWRFNKVVIS